MSEPNTYDFGESFAEITGLFEDAAEVACRGQGQGLRAETYEGLVHELERLTLSAQDRLATLRAELRR